MKKTMKRIAVTGTVLLALFGAGTGIAFASGYITWGGTQDYQETINLLEQLDRRSSELGSERSQMIRELIARTEIIETKENELLDKENQLLDKENELLDKDNQIDSLEQEIGALEKRIEGGQTSQDQLKQAEQDMNAVKNKTQEVLENMSRNFSQ